MHDTYLILLLAGPNESGKLTILQHVDIKYLLGAFRAYTNIQCCDQNLIKSMLIYALA